MCSLGNPAIPLQKQEKQRILKRLPLAPKLRSLVQRLRRVRGHSTLWRGRFASTTPLSRDFGLDRGTPIDRYYIENFLAAHAQDIRGTVLEVVHPTYSRRFGADRVTTQHVVDLTDANPNATIIGDFAEPGVLPDATFDSIILTQTMHLIFDMGAAVRQLRRALRPGGVALITVPGITPVQLSNDYRWYWSLTDDSLGRLLRDAFDPHQVTVRSFGNLFAATAFLHGAALEEVPIGKLDNHDPAYPVIVAGRAVA